MTPESAFELVGFLGTLAAVFYFGRGARSHLPRNTQLAFAILLTVSIFKYAINALEWSGLPTTFNLDYLEDYLDDVWPFAWFLFFFSVVMAASGQRSSIWH